MPTLPTRKTSLLILLWMSIAGPGLAAPTVQDYSADYTMQAAGFTLSARRELHNSNGRQYRLSQSTEHFLLTLRERSEVSVDQGKVRPLHYSYYRETLTSQKKIDTHFDHVGRKIRESLTDKPVKDATLPLGIQDKLSYQLQMQLDLINRSEPPRTLSYTYFDRGKSRQYRFVIVGAERLKTPAGVFRALRLKLDRGPDQQRQTTVWLAQDWQYMILKITQNDEDGHYELALRGGTMAGKPIQGL